MKKLLISLTLLLTMWSISLAGTQYDVTATGADSVFSGATSAIDQGFSRINVKIAMDASTRLYVMYQHHVSTVRYRAFVTSNWGTSWTTYLDLFGNNTAGIHDHSTVQAFGDSAFMIGAQDGAVPTKIRKWVAADTSNLGLGTIVESSTNNGDRVGVVSLGATLGVLVTTEGTTDSTYFYQTDGAFSNTVTYIERGKTTKLGGGPRVPFTWATKLKGGIALFDVANEDLYWADTAVGFKTLSTALVPDDIPALGNSGEHYFALGSVKDSFGLVIWQKNVVAATCSLLYRPFHISAAGGASPTVTYDAAAGVLMLPGNIPGGRLCDPTISALNGTDTVIAYYIKWTDTANVDSATIMYRLSTDKGATWGTETVFRPAVNTDFIWTLQTPPKIYRSDNNIRMAAAWCDSTTARDSIHVYLSAITTAPASCDTLVTFLLDSLHNDYSAEGDSVRFRTVTSSQTPNDSVILCWSTSAYPDSSEVTNRFAFAYTASKTDTTKKTIALTETGTVYASAWVRTGATWSLRKTVSRTYTGAALAQPYTLLKKKKG